MDETNGATPCVGVVGLGLIGGSFAKAYRAAGWRVLGADTDPETMDVARIETVAAPLDDTSLADCDLVVLAAYPDACLSWLEANAEALGALGADGPLVIDTAGVKRHICASAFALAAERGFAFLGTHPMAGTQFSGFAHARADLFCGAPCVLVPPSVPDAERLELLDRATTLLKPLGFGFFSVADADTHDEVIAFTSQLAHVVSNAYVKSPTARVHHGFSAGSYRDLTRVAHLNPAMWAELMCENADYLSREIACVTDALDAYRAALDARDQEQLRLLLAEGDRIKRALDAHDADTRSEED